MTMEWHPIINENLCTGCGTCLTFAQCGTFVEGEDGKPQVMAPNNCSDHCHGCGNRCPVGAITYVGDNTGWVPPALRPPDANRDDVY